MLFRSPSQKQALLSAIGGSDPTDSNLVVFNHMGYVPQLPVEFAFSLQENFLYHLVHRTIIDEGASTCIMSLNFWKSLGSMRLSQCSTALKAFDGRTYKPCGIINNLHVELGGKIVNVDVDVVDGPLEYNIILGRPWVYAMTAIVSTYFRMIAFPYKCTITVINQLSFFASTLQVTGSVPFVHAPQLALQNICVGFLKDSTLMGTFA